MGCALIAPFFRDASVALRGALQQGVFEDLSYEWNRQPPFGAQCLEVKLVEQVIQARHVAPAAAQQIARRVIRKVKTAMPGAQLQGKSALIFVQRMYLVRRQSGEATL